jgi:hypothetical protein
MHSIRAPRQHQLPHQQQQQRARRPPPPPLVLRQQPATPLARGQCARRPILGRCSASPSTTRTTSPRQPPSNERDLLPSYADVAAAAARRGLRLERATTGPFYRIELYEGEDRARRRGERRAERERARRAERRRAAVGGAQEEGVEAAASPNAPAPLPPSPPPPQPLLLATTDGFCVPKALGGYVHCDTLRIPQQATLGDEDDSDDKDDGAGRADGGTGGSTSTITSTSSSRDGALGLMPLIGCAVLAHAREAGCARAEILAIDDDDGGEQHRRLVAYYRYFGFKAAHRVGGRGFFADIPHLLVWGGVGLRMDLEVTAALARWARVLRRGGGGGA